MMEQRKLIVLLVLLFVGNIIMGSEITVQKVTDIKSIVENTNDKVEPLQPKIWMHKNIPAKKDKPVVEFQLRTSGETICQFKVGRQIRASGKWKIWIDDGSHNCKLISVDLLEDGRIVGRSVMKNDYAIISLSNYFDMGKYEMKIKILGPEGVKLKVFMKKEK